MTSQGTAHGRFTRAIKTRNLWAAEMSLRELEMPTLEAALAYLDLLAEQKPEKLERAAVRWHGRLETEATFLTLAESQLVLAPLASLCAGERDAIEVLRRLRRVRPTLVQAFPSRSSQPTNVGKRPIPFWTAQRRFGPLERKEERCGSTDSGNTRSAPGHCLLEAAEALKFPSCGRMLLAVSEGRRVVGQASPTITGDAISSFTTLNRGGEA